MFFFFLMTRPPPRSPLFPYTTLFRSLIQALATAGIAYEHRRELGNPKHNRAGFAGSDADRSQARAVFAELLRRPDRKSTRLNSSHGYISYAVFCLKKKKERRISLLRI